jgi:hypothetical protein
LLSDVEKDGFRELAESAIAGILSLTPYPSCRMIGNEIGVYGLDTSNSEDDKVGRLRKIARWIKENPGRCVLIALGLGWDGYLAYFFSASYFNIYADKVVASEIIRQNRLIAHLDLSWPPLARFTYGMYTPSAPVNVLPSPQREFTEFAIKLYNDLPTKVTVGVLTAAENIATAKHVIKRKTN